MDVTYAWAPITKSEEQDDGTLMVYGPAASSDLDGDKQRLNADWLDRAMPEWAQTGNIREQHDAKRAVGVGVGLTKADGVHHIAAHIVDPIAVTKIKTKVLKGFSVGIKGPKVALGKADAPGGEIVDGTICEISVVDRPCNPGTLFEIAKADGAGGALEVVEEPTVVEKSDAEAFGIPADIYDGLADPVKAALASLAGAGAQVAVDKAAAPSALPVIQVSVGGVAVSEAQIRELVDGRLAELAKADAAAAAPRKSARASAAMADGSYPITSKSDLRKAVKAVGRGGTDHDTIRKHVISRAKALGLEAMVPNNWNPDGSLKGAAKSDDPDGVNAELVTKAEGILRDVRALAPEIVKAEEGDAATEAADGAEATDITSAQDAIACIAKLIVSEAESLAEGNLGEAIDIGLLLDAVRSLTWFSRREAAEGENGGDVYLADTPDVVKTDVPAVPAEQPETPQTPSTVAEPAAEVLTKADVADLVKSAVAEARKTDEERMATLAADLTKATETITELQALPTPGGPALTRTSTQTAVARKSDADLLRAEADGLLAKADQVADRDLRDGYLERRRELLAKADA
ncbi:hypothetical protein [Streptomyces sp. NPDC050738]|uniref:hypothetical protein n=1 Tax=Streptomyces sp. NPDC050738 TaxID=3154744 RepID=UPI00343DD97A